MVLDHWKNHLPALDESQSHDDSSWCFHSHHHDHDRTIEIGSFLEMLLQLLLLILQRTMRRTTILDNHSIAS
ncbi:hypothetical protein D3C80_1935560 [compost metagenome]